jgi:hypothetical protein
MSIELSMVICEKPVGLVPSVVLRPQSPVDNWEDRLFVETSRAKYAAAYSEIPRCE